MATLGDMERVMTSVRQLQELKPVIEARMIEAHGPDWAETRRGRGKATSLKGLHDPRFLLACIAHEDALATVFSPDDRAGAKRLTGIANNAWHEHLARFQPGDVEFAAETAARLLAAGRAALPPPPPLSVSSTFDVGGAVRRAMQRTAEDARDERRQQEEQRAAAALEAQLAQAHAERVWWLERSISTFASLASAKDNPGAQRIPQAPRRVRGWVIAASLQRTCYLTIDGRLWFRGADDDGGWQEGVPARLDPTGRHRVLLLPGASAPFADAWHGVRADGRRLSTSSSLNLDEAIAETLGELCLAHRLSWPEQDPGADAALRAMVDDLPQRQALAERGEQAMLRRERRAQLFREAAPWTMGPLASAGLGALLTSSGMGAPVGAGAWVGWYRGRTAASAMGGGVVGLLLASALSAVF